MLLLSYNYCLWALHSGKSRPNIFAFAAQSMNLAGSCSGVGRYHGKDKSDKRGYIVQYITYVLYVCVYVLSAP